MMVECSQTWVIDEDVSVDEDLVERICTDFEDYERAVMRHLCFQQGVTTNLVHDMYPAAYSTTYARDSAASEPAGAASKNDVS
jgi:hypothetical protein